MGYSQIAETCIARNGERCKDCIFYGKKCERYKKAHHGMKPVDIDGDKSLIQRRFFH